MKVLHKEGLSEAHYSCRCGRRRFGGTWCVALGAYNGGL